jgi:hypothetical protein
LCAITFLGIPNNDEINNTQNYTHSCNIQALFGVCVPIAFLCTPYNDETNSIQKYTHSLNIPALFGHLFPSILRNSQQ